MGIKANALELLEELGVNTTELPQYQVLCLPENIENEVETSTLVDSEGAIALSKLLKAEKIACANSYDLGLHTRVRERRSSEYYLGCIWILEHAALPIIAGVLARLIGERVLERLSSRGKSQVRADIKIIDGHINADIKFNGDAETFLNVFKGLSDDQNTL